MNFNFFCQRLSRVHGRAVWLPKNRRSRRLFQLSSCSTLPKKLKLLLEGGDGQRGAGVGASVILNRFQELDLSTREGAKDEIEYEVNPLSESGVCPRGIRTRIWINVRIRCTAQRAGGDPLGRGVWTRTRVNGFQGD